MFPLWTHWSQRHRKLANQLLPNLHKLNIFKHVLCHALSWCKQVTLTSCIGRKSMSNLALMSFNVSSPRLLSSHHTAPSTPPLPRAIQSKLAQDKLDTAHNKRTRSDLRHNRQKKMRLHAEVRHTPPHSKSTDKQHNFLLPPPPQLSLPSFPVSRDGCRCFLGSARRFLGQLHQPLQDTTLHCHKTPRLPASDSLLRGCEFISVSTLLFVFDLFQELQRFLQVLVLIVHTISCAG